MYVSIYVRARVCPYVCVSQKGQVREGQRYLWGEGQGWRRPSLDEWGVKSKDPPVPDRRTVTEEMLGSQALRDWGLVGTGSG